HLIIRRLFGSALVGGSQFLARDGLNGLYIASAKRGDKLRVVFAKQTLHTLDGVALIVEQMANTLEQLHVKGTIVSAPATTLHRLDLGKACFPETQHMLRKIEILRYFADRPECIRALVHSTCPFQRFGFRHYGATSPIQIVQLANANALATPKPFQHRILKDGS